MVGGYTFIRYKLTRLCHKYRDVRDSSGSRLQATAFVLILIARRLDELLASDRIKATQGLSTLRENRQEKPTMAN